MPSAKFASLILSFIPLFAVFSGCNSKGGAGMASKPQPRSDSFAASDIRPAALSGSMGDTRDSSSWYSRRTGEHLGVLTFNMEHKAKPEHLSVMVQHLRSDLAQMPDFVLCQEVKFKDLGDGHENTADVLGDLLGYHARATKRSSDSEGVAILSRYPFEYYAAKELESQTSRLLLGFNRVSVMGEFKVPAIGLVRVINVHFTNWRFEERVRTNQLRETLQWINERERMAHADVTIFGGDFNMLPDGDERPLVTNREETGSLRFQDHNTSDPTRGPDGRPNMRVDYVFIAPSKCSLQFLGEDRLFKNGLRDSDGDLFYLSDHVPVLHQYAVQAGSPSNMGTATVQAAADSAATLMR